MTEYEMVARLERPEILKRRLVMMSVAVLAFVGVMWFVSAASSQTAAVTVKKTFSRIAARVTYDANFPDRKKSVEPQMALLPDHRLVSVIADARDNFWIFSESGPISVSGAVAHSAGPVEVVGGPVIVKIS